MTRKNGFDYAHNYDVIIKWISDVLMGQTLEVIGVETGRIEEVFGFEPVEVAVKAGRVDVIFRDDTGAYYHLEEQRNLKRTDMYRFGAYHFMVANRWGNRVTDIILVSGGVFNGEKNIRTESGAYTPLIVDFTEKDGAKRLREIQEDIENGTYDNWLELVFLPLYGKEKGEKRQNFVEQLILTEIQLFRENKIEPNLIAATLIMSNKIIDRERLKQLWEEIKMLDILEIAEEKGLEKGRAEGNLNTSREMLLDALIAKFDVLPSRISENVRKIDNIDTLKALHRLVFKCSDISEFERKMKPM